MKRKKTFLSRVGKADEENIFALFDTFKNETDRGSAIVIHAYIDNLLNDFLKRRITDEEVYVKEIEGQLSFYRRINLCYLMGVLSKEEMDELKLINEIRNDFAHDVDIKSFDENGITAKCNNLKIPSLTGLIKPGNLCSRDKYTFAALSYINNFQMKIIGGWIIRIEKASTFNGPILFYKKQFFPKS